VQKLLEPPISGRIMRGVHGRVILTEELVPLPFGQVPEDDRRVMRILTWKRLSGHASQLTPAL
jgi:hypothetical protein